MAATGGSSSGNTALALIYDYNKCNDYAKVIMDKSTLVLNTPDDRFTDLWKEITLHTESSRIQKNN